MRAGSAPQAAGDTYNAWWVYEQKRFHMRLHMEKEMLGELKTIKKLLMLSLLHSGASSEEPDQATGMGAGNIRAMFPKRRRQKKH